MRYEANETDMKRMFQNENTARTRYSSSLASGMNVSADNYNYYEEPPATKDAEQPTNQEAQA